MGLALRRHYWLVIALALVVMLLVTLLPDLRITAYTVPGNRPVEPFTNNYENSIDLFDDTVVHEVVVLISDENRDKMVTTFQQTGEKDYFTADIIIDGVRINDVGIRLKGNASLRSLGGGGRQGAFGVDRGGLPDRGNWSPPAQGDRDRNVPQEGAPAVPWVDADPDRQFEAPEGAPEQELGDGAPAPFAGGRGALPGDQAQRVPPDDFGRGGMNLGSNPSGESAVSYLVKLDEYVEGQAYQGYTRIALRSYGINYDAAQLQEPVSNAAMNAVGVSATRTAFMSLQFNDDEPRLYHLSEEPDEVYVDRLFAGTDGFLYKVQQVGSTFEYLGDDPTLYERTFSQKTAGNEADLTPLIEFMKFVTEASDEAFARDLEIWFDVDAFAGYLAVNNLLANQDSLPGMGNNYYLYYDPTTERFTILAWDTNESLGKLAMGSRGADLDIYWEAVNDQFGRLLDDENTDTSPPAGNNARRFGPRMGGNHLLMKRFFETPEFLQLYKQKLESMYQALFVDGFLADTIGTYADVVTAYNAGHDLVDQATYDAAAAKTLSFVTQRQAYLETTQLLSR
jgi:spore coat protein CotH